MKNLKIKLRKKFNRNLVLFGKLDIIEFNDILKNGSKENLLELLDVLEKEYQERIEEIIIDYIEKYGILDYYIKDNKYLIYYEWLESEKVKVIFNLITFEEKRKILKRINKKVRYNIF